MPDRARSDHFPFWSAGTPVVLWTDTADFRNPHYRPLGFAQFDPTRWMERLLDPSGWQEGGR